MHALRYVCFVVLWIATSSVAFAEVSLALDEPVRLANALASTLLYSPDLKSFSAEVKAREAQALQSGLLPNPSIQSEVEDFAGSGEQRGINAAQTTVSLSQLVELGGKRSRRLRVSLLERDLASWDYEVARLNALARTTKAFVAVLVAQQHVALADELVQLANTSIEAVNAQVNVGAVSPVETLRAKVVRGRAESDRLEARKELATAKASLAASWGSNTVTFDRVEGVLEPIIRPPDLEVLLSRVAHNPDLARWAAELEQRRAVIELERAGRIPDVTVGVGGRHYNQTNDGALVLQFSLPLPVFDRNQGAILAASERLGKADAERVAVELNVRSGVTIAQTGMLTAYEQFRSLSGSTILEAKAAFEGALDAYRQGKFRYLETLDAQRTLFELREERLRALAAYYDAAVDLERLTGTPLMEELNEEQ